MTALFRSYTSKQIKNLGTAYHATLTHFLLPALPAWRYGEERVFVDAEICPELRDGLITAMEWFRHWYDWYEPNRPLVKIEAKKEAGIIGNKV